MADMFCSKCNVGWQILAHDQFCGYCGCKAFGFSVKWKDDPLFYKGDITENRELAILVENVGATPITFQPIQIHSGGALTLSEPDKPFTVTPGKIHIVEVYVDPTKLKTEYPEKVIVCAENVSPNQDGIKSLEFQALPPPEFTLKPNRVSLEYPKSREIETVDFNIEFQQNPFHIEGIESSQEWINSVDLSKAPESVRLEINCHQLTEGPNSKTLSFQLRGPSQPIEKQIQIQTKILPEPPTLFVVPEENLEIIQDREKSHTLTLKNTGEDPLTITDIVLADSSDLVQLPDLDRIIIEGSRDQNIDVPVSTVGIDPGTYPINFKISSNCDTASEYNYTLNITVKEREEYPHYLAIDFGTTNSCCAYLDKSYDLKLLPLDAKAIPPDIMPSSIIYHSQPKDGKTYQVGYDAETNRTSVSDGPYYISSAKRWLGYRWHRKFPKNQELQPCDVVSDIIEHIINKAEDHLEQKGIESKITKCVITHPTMFTRQQQDDLRQAFENIGISELVLIDEASAASMGIIFKKQETIRKNYRLLVYDFGGGTIDIVLSQVKTDGDDITIEPLARGGNPRYGGDDVTQAIVNSILNEYKQRIEATNPTLNFHIPYFKPGQILQVSENQEIERATRENAATLYRRAEEMKIALNTQLKTEFFLPLKVIVGNEVFESKDLIGDDSAVELSVQQFQSYIKPALKDTFADIDAMIKENDEHLPDIVILAGQSSKMQLVKDTMAAHFEEKYQKNIEIHLDEHPKVCVVMGAAQYGFAHESSDEDGVGIKVNLSNKTPSRLGIVRRRGVTPIFGEIISKGKLIPDESVGTTNFRIQSRAPYVDVHEHFGLDDNLKNASRIAGYTLNLSEDVSEQALRKARLKMAVKVSGEIELTALVGDDEYTFTVKKQEPEFVDEIHRTDSIIEADNAYALSVHQGEAEEVVREARGQVTELERAYRDGEPIKLNDI